MNLENQLGSLELRKAALDREQLFFQLGKSQASRLPQARAFLFGAAFACLSWLMLFPTPKNHPVTHTLSHQETNPVEKSPYSLLALNHAFHQTGDLPRPGPMDTNISEQAIPPMENRSWLQHPELLLEQR